METFVMNGFSIMLYSFCSYYLLAWWIRYKDIRNWVTYMNALTISWILGSFTFLLPDLITYSAQTYVGGIQLFITGTVLTLATVFAVINNRRHYGRPDKSFRRLLWVGGSTIVGVRNFSILSSSQLLNLSIFFCLTVILITAISYVKYLRKISTSALYYLISSVVLMIMLLFFWQGWEKNFSVFVLCGALLLQIVGYAVFYLEHMYNRNLQVKADERLHIQKSQAEESRSYYLENFDSVTQLRNQINLQRKFNLWQEDDAQQWLLLLNITNFRQFNNTFGYQEGNKLLKQMADWLILIAEQEKTVFRFENDVFLMRFMGNESSVLELSKFITADFDEHFSRKCESATMGLQICITQIKTKMSLESHIQELSIARTMTELGERISFYNDARIESYKRQMDLQRDIREAVRDRKFTVFYQPKVHLATGVLMGAEALVRMQRGESIISPGVFMPYAESSGIIKEIGFMVIEQVFTHIKTYDFSVPISINLSAVQLFDENFIKELSRKRAMHQVDPEKITFEITETSVMKHYEEGVRQLKKIREMGFKVSLDDFGTGYSSFAYLMDMPIQELKVDRSLIKNIVEIKKQQILLKTLVNLSRDLSLDLIIEGVETEEQRQMILEIGGTYGQGFYFDAPMPLHEFVINVRQKLDVNGGH